VPAIAVEPKMNKNLQDLVFNSALSQALIALSAKAIAVGRGARGSVDGDALAFSRFVDWLKQLRAGIVLEIGTRRVEGYPSTLRRDWVSGDVRYVACDFQSGLDVDVVADVEQLSKTFAAGSIDAVIGCSVFEHIRKPWLASEEIGKVLRPGGLVYIQTHQSFPIHAHPFDYWRFSREGLEILFSAENGFKSQATWYEYPASILSQRDPRALLGQAYLNVNIVAERA
jgi:SAM-dependent methyltransferase